MEHKPFVIWYQHINMLPESKSSEHINLTMNTA